MNTSRPQLQSLPRRFLPRTTAAFACGMLLLGSLTNLVAQSEQTGSLRGKVYNPGTGNYLEGAVVTIVGTDQAVLTDRLGQYVFAGVPSGEMTLKATYPGLAEATASATVRAGETVFVADIGLGADTEIVTLADFVVQGEREGQAKAIIMQRDAPNIVTTIATDIYGNVGSNSVGNLLQYVPGLTTEGFDGEAFTASVRGMPPGYGLVTTDGAQLASANEGGLNRTTYVLNIGLVNFSEIEVIKAPTPDMAADATGGVINLRTRSVFSSKTPRSGRLSVGLGTTLNRDMVFKQPHPSFTLNLRQLLGGDDPKWGFTINASSNTRYLPRNQTNIDYESTFTTINPEFPYVNSVSKQIGFQEVTRRSAGGRIEYKPNGSSLYSLGLTYNYLYRFNHNNTRGWASTSNTIGTPVLPADYATGGLYTGPVGIVAGYTDDEVFWPKARVTFSSKRARTVSKQLALRFAGEHNLGAWKIDYDANYSDYNIIARESGSWPGGFGGDSGLTINNVGLRVTGFSDSHNYRLEHVGGNHPLDLTRGTGFFFRDWNLNKTETSVKSGTLNVTRLLEFVAAPTTLKAGVSYRERDQDQTPTGGNARYNYIGPASSITTERFGVTSPFAASDPRNPQENDMNLFGPGIIDALAMRTDIQQNPQDWSAPVPFVHPDRGYTEGISAAYFSATTRLFQKRLTLLGGVRVERTDVEARDALVADPIAGTPTTESKSHYSDTFPSMHVTWRHSSGLQFRASYSTSIGRPDPGSIIPNTTVTPHDDGEDTPGHINQVNVGLKPRYVDNYDASVEYYSEKGGRFSFGVFKKDLQSFIFSTTSILGPGNEFGDEYDGWELRTQRNGGRGRVEGYEFDYQSPSLGNFVSFLEGFTVFANYTHLVAQGDYGDGGSQVLTGFVPESGNAGISYNRSGTSIRVRANFRGEYLRFPNNNPALERWEYDQTKIDLNLERKIRRNLSVYLDLINVTNTMGRRFRGNPDLGRRLHWVDDNGPEFYAGLNYVF